VPEDRHEPSARRPGEDVPTAAGLAPVLSRNIHSLTERRRREERRASWQDRLAEAITRFAGSMAFVWLHLALFGFWIVANLGLVPGVPRWDPTFVVLAMWASVEAIFLSTFVLISQNRMAAADAARADLDLQVSLLAEHEVSRMAIVLAAVAAHLGVRTEADGEMAEIGRDVAPEAVLDGIAAEEQAT
jgi:uncharacterized membrane protein